jgi:hypothetical protein
MLFDQDQQFAFLIGKVIFDQYAISTDPDQMPQMCQLIRIYKGRTCD